MNNKEISKYIALSDRQTEFEFTVKNNYDFSLKRQNIRLDLIEEADGFLVLSYKGLRYPVEIVSRKQNTGQSSKRLGDNNHQISHAWQNTGRPSR